MYKLLNTHEHHWGRGRKLNKSLHCHTVMETPQYGWYFRSQPGSSISFGTDTQGVEPRLGGSIEDLQCDRRRHRTITRMAKWLKNIFCKLTVSWTNFKWCSMDEKKHRERNVRQRSNTGLQLSLAMKTCNKTAVPKAYYVMWKTCASPQMTSITCTKWLLGCCPHYDL